MDECGSDKHASSEVPAEKEEFMGDGEVGKATGDDREGACWDIISLRSI